jgi:hypothetical protein
MRWRQTKQSQNVEDYRGRSTGVGRGGKIGIVGVVAVIGAYFLGIDPRLVMGLLGAGGGAPQSEAPVEAGAPSDEAGAFVSHVLGDTEETWTALFTQAGQQYRLPTLRLFEQGFNTGCGSATSAAGPFYCPPDQTIYLDTGFYDDLQARFGASGGPLAEMYVVAHEWGHHIQNITGIMNQVDRQSTGPTSDAVRLELQADCFAGSWAGRASTTPDPDTGVPFLEPITRQQMAEALDAAAAVGDDRIQSTVSGDVQPHTWTHGSSEQRQRWFATGYEQGAGACDTFSATSL